MLLLSLHHNKLPLMLPLPPPLLPRKLLLTLLLLPPLLLRRPGSVARGQNKGCVRKVVIEFTQRVLKWLKEARGQKRRRAPKSYSQLPSLQVQPAIFPPPV
jgi:hypothetical protein